MSRAPQYGTRELLTPEEFTRRASGDEASRDRAVNQETILRNEFGVRTFGYTSFVVDPPNGQMPAMTAAGRARAANRDAMGMEVYTGQAVEGREEIREFGGTAR